MATRQSTDTSSSPKVGKTFLDELYTRYNHREWVHPDPLEFLYRYEDPLDREIVGLVASSLAYGRVVQIVANVALALDKMGSSPRCFLDKSTKQSLSTVFRDLKHRFTTGEELASLLYQVKRILERYGSLQACFMRGFRESDANVLNALTVFADELTAGKSYEGSMLIPSPCKGSACKRLNLFLRWMVRCDEVDPGGWHHVPPSKLIVPMDTHMNKIGLLLGLTRRKHADMRAALEVTEAFRILVPQDPVRYDFALTRLGIREELDFNELSRHCNESG